MRTTILLALLCLCAPCAAQVNIEVFTVCGNCDYVAAHAYDVNKEPLPSKVQHAKVDRFTVRPGETFVCMASGGTQSIHQQVKANGVVVYSEAGSKVGTTLQVGSDNQLFR